VRRLGSPLTGGYGGAKWTQKLLALYLQSISDERKLGIRFVALVPKQMIAGTEIADRASKVYTAKAGILTLSWPPGPIDKPPLRKRRWLDFV